MSEEELAELGLEECEGCGGYFLPEDLTDNLCAGCDELVGEF